MACWGVLHALFGSSDFFSFKINLFQKIFSEIPSELSNSFYPDQVQHFAGPDLGPLCLQKPPKHLYPIELKMAKNFTYRVKSRKPRPIQRYFLQDLVQRKGVLKENHPCLTKALSTLQSQAGWSGSSASWGQTRWLPKRTPKLPFIIHCTYS